MVKKTMTLLLALTLLVSACVMVPAASLADLLPMYVYTENGKSLNVRSTPEKGNNVIGHLDYGEEVMVEFINSTGWAVIFYKDQEAYVQARFLQDTKPGPSKKAQEEEEKQKEQEKLAKEIKSETGVDQEFYVAVRATRASGWINFRVGPGKITTRVASFGDGKELRVIGETTNWYKAVDPDTGKTGYIHKNYVRKLNREVEATAEDGKEQLGSLNVNGEFDIRCRLPEGYKLQVVDKNGTRIVASVLSEDMSKPQLYLSIAYDESYGDVARMNDLTDEDLAILEESFTEMNDVEITYRETGYGTKLLVARETGADTDFVDILSIYQGYFVEFNMTPNPNAADQTLTEEQIQMCVDFLTEVDFVPAA